MSNFSDNLVYLRQRAGMSQQELAERSGCSRSAIGMYETGKREPDLETLETFADIFNVDMDFLTGRVESSEWSVRFRQKLSELIATASLPDLEAAGLKMRDLELVIAGSSKLTFDYACDIADAFGVSFDYMLSRQSEKVPTSGERGGYDSTARMLFDSLPDDLKAEAVRYLQYLAERKGN